MIILRIRNPQGLQLLLVALNCSQVPAQGEAYREQELKEGVDLQQRDWLSVTMILIAFNPDIIIIGLQQEADRIIQCFHSVRLSST